MIAAFILNGSFSEIEFYSFCWPIMLQWYLVDKLHNHNRRRLTVSQSKDRQKVKDNYNCKH